MKIWQFVIFFSIALGLYSAVNFYIYQRGLQAIQPFPAFKPYYIAAFIFFSTAYIIGRAAEKAWISPVSDFFVWTGSFWLGAMFYFFLILAAIDLMRFINLFVPVIPNIVSKNYDTAKIVAMASATGTVLLLLIAGYINTLNPKITNLEFAIDKTVPELKEFKITAVSDIHLGTIINNGRATGLVKMINSLKPDIVLLCGDILDEDLAPVIRQNLGDCLMNIKSPLGIIAATGNHEYIGGIENSAKYLQAHRILLLRDQMVKLSGIYFASREDKSSGNFTGIKRKPLSDIISKADKTCPIILLDHQPATIKESAEAGVDLQISGHTHHGQMFPINLITRGIFDVSGGYKRIDNTHVYVSSGFGTWGPPVRIGNRPEIVNIKLIFK